MTTIAANLQDVRERLDAACRAAGRSPDSVQLLAVSKTFGPEVVVQAFEAGQRAFGENYVQEAARKIDALRHLPLEWHCIGPIQANKTRVVAQNFDWVQTLDRLQIAQRLSSQRPAEMAPLQVCIQVNIDGGSNKSGVAPQDTLTLARQVAALPRLRLRGLMCIPEPSADFATAVAIHRQAKALFDHLNAHGLSLDTLSLGMSADLEAAVSAGSTMVRVGSAVFGKR